MEMCSRIKRNLLLDVHGALDERERAELEAHLTECRACRQEREKLLAMVKQVRKTSEPPELSQREADEMISAVRNKLREKPGGRFKKVFSGGHFPLIPIAAAACLAVAVSLLAYRMLPTRDGLREPAPQQYSVPRQDLEVVRNLDLLQNMEAIEKLVHIVDENAKDVPLEDSHMDTHGKRHSRHRDSYA
jgi:anti-sigma factor RsiW